MSKLLSVLIASVFAASALLNQAAASPASPIWQFDVLAVASATYNSSLPAGLNPDNALYLINWDVVPGPSQIKSSNQSHGGGWVAFVTETGGYAAITHPYASYTGGGLTYFGQHLITSGSTVIGFMDEWYCSCNGANALSASTVSIAPGGSWYAQMYVR